MAGGDCSFERPWGIRGMQNLLMDYYLYPDEIHRLHNALCDHYIKYLKWGIRELQPDAFWTSDDLGHQKQLFMRPESFRELIKPYYMRIGAYLEQQKPPLVAALLRQQHGHPG